MAEDRITRLLNRIIENRRRYAKSVENAGGRVYVRPSVPRGGVVDFQILGMPPLSREEHQAAG